MPVRFLTEDQAAYGRFTGPPSQADLERVFFLDDEDRAMVGQRRGQHMKLGFVPLQLVTVRWLGTFLEDPLDVSGVALESGSGTSWTSCWRCRPGRGCRTWSGGARE